MRRTTLVVIAMTLLVSFVLVPGIYAHSDGTTHAETRAETSSLDASDSPAVASGKETEKSQSSADENSDGEWLEVLLPGFTGAKNLHPMFVHFPIVFLWAALGFSLVTWLRHPTFYERLARWMLYLGLVSLPVTAASGFWAVGGWGGGHNATHRNLMLITTALAFALWGLLRLVRGRDQLYRIVLTVGLLVVTITMTLGADRGAWLVYVEGAGVQSEGHVHKKAP